jgi:LppP/LprE lipoprotein
VAQEVIQLLRLGTRELLGEVGELGEPAANARPHDLIVTGGVAVVLEHQVIAVAAQELLVRHPHGLQGVLAIVRATGAELLGGPPEAVGDPLEATLERREEQVALGWEQAEDVRLGDTDAAGDALDGSAVQTSVGELVHGRRDQLLAALGSGNPAARLPGRGLRDRAHCRRLAAANNGVELRAADVTARSPRTAQIRARSPVNRQESPRRAPIPGEYHDGMGAIARTTRLLSCLGLGLAAGGALSACGSGTKTVSVSGEPPSQPATGASAPRTTSQPRAHTTPAPDTNGATSPTTTRTAKEPAFIEQENTGTALGKATVALRERGFVPANTSDFHPGQALEVLVGVRKGSGDGYGQQAFFFVNGRYIGTDTSEPSAALRVLGQSDTEVTLSYPLYRRGDPLCCPGGGHTSVRFQLNNGKLTPLDPIPPVSSNSGPSRQ